MRFVPDRSSFLSFQFLYLYQYVLRLPVQRIDLQYHFRVFLSLAIIAFSQALIGLVQKFHYFDLLPRFIQDIGQALFVCFFIREKIISVIKRESRQNGNYQYTSY